MRYYLEYATASNLAAVRWTVWYTSGKGIPRSGMRLVMHIYASVSVYCDGIFVRNTVAVSANTPGQFVYGNMNSPVCPLSKFST